MIFNNGFIYTKDSNRIFINTSLGCVGQCEYCYLPKMGYSNSSNNIKTIFAQDILDCIKLNKIHINKKTLISIGCYSECWDDYNKKETINLIKYFLKKGNQIQINIDDKDSYNKKIFMKENDVNINNKEFKNFCEDLSSKLFGK